MSARSGKRSPGGRRSAQYLLGACAAVALSACDGDSSSTSYGGSAQKYGLSGTVSGLNGSGLVLSVDGSTQAVASGAKEVVLGASLPAGTAYTVRVATQPSAESCTVANGTGTMPASAVTDVAVSCSPNLESVLYSFAGVQSGGKFTGAALIQGSDGSFYGTTFGGGANGDGTVFKITPAGAEMLLYSFTGAHGDGANPNAALIQGSDGNLYGTTWDGGANNDGAVFKITPAGVETVLHSLSGSPGDGMSPNASLVQGSDGNFYSTTARGGAIGDGTVFKITPTGVETVLYSFGGTPDEANPLAALVQGSDGNLYGTTWDGGANGEGMVFSITPAGVETVLYSFGATKTDGTGPQATLIQDSDGNFLGTTPSGGANGDGTVFKVTPAGVETVLYSFGASQSDGTYAEASLIQGSDGNFYGTTSTGGANGDGTVFRITPAGVETVVYSFAGGPTDGANPNAALIQGSDGNFYGTTVSGGVNGDGVVFKILAQ
jgi:uncharacterized repeat protein (TIGR03803 family)